jgi:hypothetical protein
MLPQAVRVTDQNARRQIHAFVERAALEAAHAAKQLETAGAGVARY